MFCALYSKIRPQWNISRQDTNNSVNTFARSFKKDIKGVLQTRDYTLKGEKEKKKKKKKKNPVVISRVSVDGIVPLSYYFTFTVSAAKLPFHSTMDSVRIF